MASAGEYSLDRCQDELAMARWRDEYSTIAHGAARERRASFFLPQLSGRRGTNVRQVEDCRCVSREPRTVEILEF